MDWKRRSTYARTTNRSRLALTFIALSLFCLCPAPATYAVVTFDWEELPSLPVPLTGHFAGVHEGVLIVAGGASANPLRSASNEIDWYDSIYLLESGATEWLEAGRLPSPRAFGACVSTADGVWLIGGSDGVRHFSDILRLRFRDGELVLDIPSPLQNSMPSPVAMTSAAVIGDTAYLFGGLDAPGAGEPAKHFWSLDLSRPQASWQALDPGPVSGRILPALAARDGALYLAGGAARVSGGDDTAAWRPLTDAYRFSPEEGWSALAEMPTTIENPTAIEFGVAHVFVFGSKKAIAVDSETGENSAGLRSNLLLAYHTVTDSWGLLDATTRGAGARALHWDGAIALVGGEDESGMAGASAYAVSPAPRGSRLSLLDYAALGVYFGLLVWMGFYFSRREANTETFFLGNRRIPWWAVGISIFGTSVSAITYMTVPALAYTGDWVFILNSIGILFLAPFIVVYYMPRLRESPVSTAYEYLEKRFNLLTRIYGSIVFGTFQLGRMAIVLYLPAIALSAATGLNITFCILAMGLLATLYTVLGGIEAVIWTDVIQSVVLVFGAILALVLVIMNIDGGLSAAFTTAAEADKFHTFNWSWDLTTSAVWVAVIGGIFASGYPAMADQTVVQRYLSTASAREASKAVWTNALLTIPIQLLFFGLGTALWVFFKSHPTHLDPTLQHDAILPLFVVEMFPTGLRGVLIAGLFAASMSSLDSSMNSLSSVLVNDYYRRFARKATEARALFLAKALTLLFGLFGTLSALYVATINESTIFPLFIKFLGLVGGGLAGLFVLGVFTRRANGSGALVGAVLSGAAVYYAQGTTMHFFLYGMVGFLTSFIVGYLASIIGYLASRLLGSEQEV